MEKYGKNFMYRISDKNCDYICRSLRTLQFYPGNFGGKLTVKAAIETIRSLQIAFKDCRGEKENEKFVFLKKENVGKGKNNKEKYYFEIEDNENEIENNENKNF